MKKVFYTWSKWVIPVILLLILTYRCTPPAGKEEASAGGKVTESKSSLSLGNSEYVGSAKCKECHWREHDSWKHTLHSKFMQEANEYTVMGDFGRNNTLTVKVSNKAPRMALEETTTTMYQKEGKYYVNTIGPDWEFHDYEVLYVIGINREQAYVTEFANGELHVLPVEWEIGETKWEDNRGLEKHYPGNGKYWSDTERSWQFACGSCHVTGMKINYNKATDSFNTTWVDLGIGCEACHGPGNNHIQVARTLFDKEKDTIINPAKLPWFAANVITGVQAQQRFRLIKKDSRKNMLLHTGTKWGSPFISFMMKNSMMKRNITSNTMSGRRVPTQRLELHARPVMAFIRRGRTSRRINLRQNILRTVSVQIVTHQR